MAFDPSVLSEIGGYGPDPAAAQARGINLASAAQGYQSGQLDLQQKRQEMAGQAQAQQALQGVDLSDPAKANAALMKIQDPNVRMKVMGQLTQQQQRQREVTLQDIEIADQKMDTLARALDPVVAQLDQAASGKGANPAMLDARTKQLMIPTILQLQKDHPELAPEIQRFMADPNHLTYQGLKSVDAQTKWGSQAIKDRLAERRQQETERHNLATEALGGRRETTAEGKGKFTDQQEELLAELAVRNVNLPAGLRSQAQIGATLDGLIKRNPGRSMGDIAEDIKTGRLKLTAETAGARIAGGQIGKVALAANELDTFGDQVLTASKAVPRGLAGIESLTLNGLVQMTQTQGMDPNLLRLKAKLTALNNAYDQLAARGGTDQDKRAHIHQLFDARLSDESIQTLVQALKEEAVGAREAAKRTIAETTGAGAPAAGSVLPGIQSTPGAGGGGAGGPPAGAAPAPGGAPKSDDDLIAHYGGASTRAGAGGSGTTPALNLSQYRVAPGDPSLNRRGWGKRADGSEKGSGFLGLLKRPDGKVSSEISIGVEMNGKEVEIPTIVPTLSQSELDYLLKNPVGPGHPIPESIRRKAIEHARRRIAEGKSPFAQPGEGPSG